jgi:hypothetical protein
LYQGTLQSGRKRSTIRPTLQAAEKLCLASGHGLQPCRNFVWEVLGLLVPESCFQKATELCFVSGHDCSRAVNDRQYVRLYRLRKNSVLHQGAASLQPCVNSLGGPRPFSPGELLSESTGTGFCIRARLQSGRKRSTIRRALAPADLSADNPSSRLQLEAPRSVGVAPDFTGCGKTLVVEGYGLQPVRN